MTQRRIRLVIAYDGTAFCGWQIQPNGRSVQAVLNEALQNLLREPVRTIGASRTDAGVHARGNVVIFDTASRIPAEKFALALNTWLPEDVRVQASDEVDPRWHPHFTDSIKTYEYKILNRRLPDPTRRLDSLFCYERLDLAAMQKAAGYFTGTHDFASFAAGGGATAQAAASTYETPEKHGTVRTIYRSCLTCDADAIFAFRQPNAVPEAALSCSSAPDGNAGALHDIPSNSSTAASPAQMQSSWHDMIRFTVSGNGFLYHMVRIMAGTLLEVGRGALAPDAIPSILAAGDRTAAGPTAPARGLTLLGITYPL